MKANPHQFFFQLSTLLFAITIPLLIATPTWADSKPYERGKSYGEHEKHGKSFMMDSPHHQRSTFNSRHSRHEYSGHAAEHSRTGTRSHGSGYSGPHQSAEKFIQHILRAKDGLSMTETQENQLRNLQISFKKTQIKLKAEMELASLDFHELVRDEKASFTDIESKLKTVHELRADLYMASIKTRRNAKGVLTDEQRARMKAVHDRIKAHRGKKMKRPRGEHSSHGKGKNHH